MLCLYLEISLKIILHYLLLFDLSKSLEQVASTKPLKVQAAQMQGNTKEKKKSNVTCYMLDCWSDIQHHSK